MERTATAWGALRPLVLLAGLLFLPASGCSLLAGTDAGKLKDPAGDGGAPDGDAGTQCAEPCDDGVACTQDRCTANGTCEHNPIHADCGANELCDLALGCTVKVCESNADCSDNLFCTGEETCAPGAPGANGATGCLAGTIPACADDFACTADACGEDEDACTYAAQNSTCDDGVACSTDTCVPEDPGADAKGCIHVEDDAACVDFCHENATCSIAGGGCLPGDIRTCDPADECHEAYCDAQAGGGMCVSAPLDGDNDGFSPEVNGCNDGDGPFDCDDGRPTVNPGAAEVCDNNRDDNCDGDKDEDPCADVPEECASAREISLSGGATRTGSATGSFEPLADDYVTSCHGGATGGRDAVYFIDVPANLDVRIDTVGSDADTVLSVQVGRPGRAFSCSDSSWSVCSDDATTTEEEGRIWVQSPGNLPEFTERRIFILVDAKDDSEEGDYQVNVRASQRASRSCGGQTPFDVSLGGTLIGTLPSSFGAQRGSCQEGGAFYTDSAVKFRSPTGGALGLSVASSQFTPILYVRQGSCSQGNEVDCEAGASIGGGVNAATMTPTVQANMDYFILVDGGGAAQTYVLQVKP